MLPPTLSVTVELLPTKVLTRFSVPTLRMPPPWSDFPCLMLNPESVTVALELVMLSTREALFPSSVTKRLADPPWIVRLLSMTSSLCKVIVKLLLEKAIVLPGQASNIACLKLPAPLSLEFATSGLVMHPGDGEGVGVGVGVGVAAGANAGTKGESEFTLAQTVRVLKSGAGLSGEKIVRSINCPPSP